MASLLTGLSAISKPLKRWRVLPGCPRHFGAPWWLPIASLGLSVPMAWVGPPGSQRVALRQAARPLLIGSPSSCIAGPAVSAAGRPPYTRARTWTTCRPLPPIGARCATLLLPGRSLSSSGTLFTCSLTPASACAIPALRMAAGLYGPALARRFTMLSATLASSTASRLATAPCALPTGCALPTCAWIEPWRSPSPSRPSSGCRGDALR